MRWSSKRLVARRDEAVRQLSLLGDFIPGSVNETWSKCGKPTCHCAGEGDPGHGPRLLWVRYEKGKTVSRTVPKRVAERVRSGVGAGQRFLEQVREISEINAVLAERGLVVPGIAGREGTGSGGSGQKRGSRG